MSRPAEIRNMKEAARSAVACVNVCLPATVVDYDDTTQKASVKLVPRFRRKDAANGNQIVCYDPPNISGVPVAFPGAGEFSITWPLAAGDTGYVVFSDRSMDEWLSSGASRTEPQDIRRHNITDAIFVPGMRPFSDALGSEAIDSSALVITGDCIKLGSSSASDFVALASLVFDQFEKLEAIVADYIVAFNAAVTIAKANNAPEVVVITVTPLTSFLTPYNASNVAATKVKAE